MTVRHNITRVHGEPTGIFVIIDGRQHNILPSHVNFDEMLQVLDNAPPKGANALAQRRFKHKVVRAVSPGTTLIERFKALFTKSGVDPRVDIDLETGVVRFDGQPVDSALADTILRFAREGHQNYAPLVRFLSKVMANPNPHSRANLFQWMQHRDFVLSHDGDFLAHKGVAAEGEYGYRSNTRGHEDVTVTFLDGSTKVYRGYVPNPIGATIEMDRSLVQHDPAMGCSVGLHVGTWRYASGWSSTRLLVKIDPRDVVSVPTDCDQEKMRVCRYTVVEEVFDRVSDVLYKIERGE
jgi:hypothetical protein